MRFKELEGKTDKEQNDMILECKKCSTEEALKNPELLKGKILVFRGNYDGFATNRLCARTLEYLEKEKRWKISDVILHEMFETSFCHHFSDFELRVNFEDLCVSTGFLMEL